MIKTVNRVGEKFTTKQGYIIEIIEYFRCDNCTIKFNDKRGTIIKNVQYTHIKRGTTGNPFHPTSYGVGYIGIGKYKSEIEGKSTKQYTLWKSMLQRCYSKAYLEKQPSYENVVVCEEWKCFQVFAEWVDVNWKSYMDSSWHLDKDIICKNCKIYSPETCSLVPNEINANFKNNTKNTYFGITKHGKKWRALVCKNGIQKRFGVYSTPKEAFQVHINEKEKHIRELAEFWKDKIEVKVYEAMCEYKIKNPQ